MKCWLGRDCQSLAWSNQNWYTMRPSPPRAWSGEATARSTASIRVGSSRSIWTSFAGLNHELLVGELIVADHATELTMSENDPSDRTFSKERVSSNRRPTDAKCAMLLWDYQCSRRGSPSVHRTNHIESMIISLIFVGASPVESSDERQGK